MQPVAAMRVPGEPVGADQPGLSEEMAAFAVLGVDVEALGSAVAKQWGLGEDILHMVRRLPTEPAVRKPDGDGELLRILGSAANEAVEALELPPAKVALALQRVVSRYSRVLKVNTRALHDAVQEARDALANIDRPAKAAPDAEPEGDGIESSVEFVAPDAPTDA